MCVVFVALGSRGDVQPLAVLASRLAAERPVALVSHQELAKLKEDPSVLSPLVDFRPLSKPCFMEGSAPELLDLQGRRRSEWIEAILKALDAELLVCNLFAMPPVYHLSERLDIPWICCSPSLIPYQMLVSKAVARAWSLGCHQAFEKSWPAACQTLWRRCEH